MYHRHFGDEEAHHTAAAIAEKIRKLLARATVLMLILMFAPMLYEAMSGDTLDHLAGANTAIMADIQWGIMVATAFVIAGLVGVARVGGRCTSGTR